MESKLVKKQKHKVNFRETTAAKRNKKKGVRREREREKKTP